MEMTQKLYYEVCSKLKLTFYYYVAVKCQKIDKLNIGYKL